VATLPRARRRHRLAWVDTSSMLQSSWVCVRVRECFVYRPCTGRGRSVGLMCDMRLCISCLENHKMHIAHLGRGRSVGRCAICGFVLSGKSQDAYRTSRPRLFGWSMCDMRFCIVWKITRCISHISTDVRLVDVRYSVLYFSSGKMTRHISRISTEVARDSVGRR
jgi:hypothetical protein